MKLIKEASNINLADKSEYPHTVAIEKRCVNILSRLYHANPSDNPVGTATIGSSEAIMLAGLALKWHWKEKCKQAGKPYHTPNLIMGANVQVVWHKFVRYFDVEPRFVNLTEDCYVLNPERIYDLADENTIGVVGILGSTLTGEYEDIQRISAVLDEIQRQKGFDIPIHVDAASGGFVAPFVQKDLEWDFRVPRVVSINASGHKYGMVYPGSGWAIWRSKDYLHEDLIFHVNYLGGDLPTFNLNFSRPASHVIAQYYNFLRLGQTGYSKVISQCMHNAQYLAQQVDALGPFDVISKENTLPVVTWTNRTGAEIDLYEFSDQMQRYGWIIPSYTLPKDIEHMVCCRIVVRRSLSRDMVDNLVSDMRKVINGIARHTSKTAFPNC